MWRPFRAPVALVRLLPPLPRHLGADFAGSREHLWMWRPFRAPVALVRLLPPLPRHLGAGSKARPAETLEFPIPPPRAVSGLRFCVPAVLVLQLKESVHGFAQEHIAPHAAAIDSSNYFPKEVNLWKLMGDFILHGLTSPGGGSVQMAYAISEKDATKASQVSEGEDSYRTVIRKTAIV